MCVPDREFFHAGSDDVALNGGVLRHYLPVCEGVQETEVTHGSDYGSRTHSFRPVAGIPGGFTALPGEILKMSANGWLPFAVYSIILLAVARPVGLSLVRV